MPELAGRTESFVSTQNPRSSVFIGGQIMDLRGWFMTVYLYWPPMNADSWICWPSNYWAPGSSSPAPVAGRMSNPGAARRGPRSTRPSRSASAWNLTRMTRPLELRNQFCMRPPRLLVLRFSDALSFREVGVYLFLVPQVKRQCAMHLFERQCRVRIDHTLGRHPLAKQIHERVKRDSRPPD